uniref:Uncharacterized protein n=1 Tax=Panagrellus redivivus TaxID=6233 RepID=A0A7E4ZSP0_PANRE
MPTPMLMEDNIESVKRIGTLARVHGTQKSQCPNMGHVSPCPPKSQIKFGSPDGPHRVAGPARQRPEKPPLPKTMNINVVVSERRPMPSNSHTACAWQHLASNRGLEWMPFKSKHVKIFSVKLK